METTASISGVYAELRLLLHSFFLGFLLRMAYNLLLIFRLFFRHKRFWISLEDMIFWIWGACVMFGLLFTENNGTPRLYSTAGVLCGMALCHIGPSRMLMGLLKTGKKQMIKFVRNLSGKYCKKKKKKIQ